ncbi:Katanin p60 ATPase-containing subunit A1 [Forsythia ovata]|uniref:Katanin p60 ATPase-containing subunit A1 n=1 Tax=Forsythia ovata TaxID=205694 RepID=A0ABD1PFQ0_9LAMI
MVGASLSGLQDNQKLAREYALEGFYDTSIIFFDGSIAQINKRANSPPISTRSSFIFQPMDEYPTSSSPPMNDPDVWRLPSRDFGIRRPMRSGQVGTRKLPQEGTWARGASTRMGTTGRRGKTGGSSKANLGVRASAPGKKGTGKSTSGKQIQQ